VPLTTNSCLNGFVGHIFFFFNLLIAERSAEDSYVISNEVLCRIQVLWQFEYSPHYQFKG